MAGAPLSFDNATSAVVGLGVIITGSIVLTVAGGGKGTGFCGGIVQGIGAGVWVCTGAGVEIFTVGMGTGVRIVIGGDCVVCSAVAFYCLPAASNLYQMSSLL